MEATDRAGRNRAGLVTFGFLLLLSFTSMLNAAERDRVRETRARIESLIKECRAEWKADRVPPIDELRVEFESLATDTEGLKLLGKYQAHRIETIALLAVRAIGTAPEELRLYAGKLLASRVGVKHLTAKRRLVYIETVKALGRTGYLGGGSSLLKTLQRSKDPEVCHAIVEALGRLEDARAVRDLYCRLTTGTSVGLRGPKVGSGPRSRRQQAATGGGSSDRGHRQGDGVNGGPLGAGGAITSLGEDGQPADETTVTHLVYEVLSKLLGADFVSRKAVDDFLRSHKSELKRAKIAVEQRVREQNREIARLLN